MWYTSEKLHQIYPKFRSGRNPREAWQSAMKILFFVSVLFLLSACPSKPWVVRNTEEKFAEENVAIYVVSHGWHTGIVVPAGNIQSILPQLGERFGDTAYIEFGWGDNMFYPANEITTALTLRALLWPTESVIHAVAIPEQAAVSFPGSRIEKLCISGSDYSLLMTFIAESFYKNEENNIVQLQYGIYGDSQFYQGEGAFHLMNTCNVWTATALQSAGMDISPALKLTADSVMDYIHGYNQTLKGASGGQTSSEASCR